MEAVFLTLLNMSITASWLVLAVIAFRFIFKKAPKALHVILWALVGVRLICPFSFESVLSLVPSAETVPQDIMYSDAPVIHTGIPFMNSTINPIISDSLAPEPSASVNPMQVIVYIASIIWIAGMAAMVLYTFISYWSIHRKIRESVTIRDNVWMCDRIDTPFILGVFRPQIYLPSSMSEEDITYVLAHEKAHLKRHDHWWKPLGFALLTVYWFNPLLWVAYVLLCRDIELACDEKVIKEMGIEIKKPYSDALINCSIPRRAIAACPLAFGEVGVKERVKTVLSYKKPAFWIILLAVVACVVVAVCFLTNPKKQAPIKWFDYYGNPEANTEEVLQIKIPQIPGLTFTYESYVITISDKNGIVKEIGTQELLPPQLCESAYFYELTGDNVPELCMTMTLGSGWVHSGVAVYNCVTEELYWLVDGSYYEFSLHEIDNELVVNKTKYKTDYILEQGKLALRNNSDTNQKELVLIPTNEYKESYVLKSGLYQATSSENGQQPYFRLDTTKKECRMGGGLIYSAALFGTYEFDGNKLALKVGDEVYVLYLAQDGSFVYDESVSTIVSGIKWMKNGMVFERLKEFDDDISSNESQDNIKWFDYYRNPEANYEETIKKELPEFPGITFTYQSGAITVSNEKGVIKELCGGMAEICHSAYFYDLTGDKKPELCMNISVGSGMIDTRVVVYDFVKDATYQLADRGHYDYALYLVDEELIVNKTKYFTNYLVERGGLEIRKNSDTDKMELVIVPTENFKENYVLESGMYVAGVDEAEPPTSSIGVLWPYFILNTTTKEVHIGESMIMSYARHGKYEFDGSKLTLTISIDEKTADVYVLYLNQYGGFVYDEGASILVSESQWFKNGMVFALT